MTSAPSPVAAIRTDGLTKRFAAFPALSGVDLAVAEGSSVAIFGPNGAGKTTLIRVLTLGLRPTAGKISIAGLDPRREDRAIRQAIGVISHQSFLYDDLTPHQNLVFFAGLYGVVDARARAGELLDSVELTHRADDPVRTLSRGMQQRVSLARALVHDPRVVFLDEPFTGLDPHAAGLLRRTLERLHERGRTIFLVTHNLTQGLELCDGWVILARGRILDRGRTSETDRAGFEQRYFQTVAGSRR